MTTHVVLAWELGAGYGHAAGLRPLAEAYLSAGCRVSVIARYVGTAHAALAGIGVEIWQAPFWNGKTERLDATFTMPEILLGFGYAQAEQLWPYVDAWCRLLDHLRPDTVVIDHGPTALLACRVLDLRVATYGTAFFITPNVTPSPVFPGMVGATPERIEHNEAIVCASINEVLHRFGKPPIESFAGLFHPGRHFLCTLPELDHYGDRAGAEYHGPRFEIDRGEPPRWPGRDGPRILAYLKEESRGFKSFAAALGQIDAVLALHVPSPSRALVQQCADLKNVELHPEPIRLRDAYEQADAAICHAGHGVVAGALIHGLRLLLAPEHLEQSVLAFRLAQQRLAMVFAHRQARAPLPQVIEAMLTHEQMGANARAFADRHGDFDQAAQLARIVSGTLPGSA